jgi:type II secretion system protein N
VKHRIVWIIAAVLLALPFVLLLGVNIYVQSRGTQEKLHRALSDALGMPVTIGSTSYTPWGGLVCKDILIDPDQSKDHDLHSVRAAALRAKVDVGSLFSNQIRINKLLLDTPVVVLTQAGGRLEFPSAPSTNPQEATSPGVASEPERQPTEIVVQDRPSEVVVETEAEREAVELLLGGTEIRNGTVILRDEKLRPIVEVSGIEATSDQATLKEARGTIRIGSLRVRNKLELTHLQSPFHYLDGKIELPEIKGELAGGEVRGSFSGETQGEARPYETEIFLERITLESVIAQLGGPSGRAAGHFDGHIRLSGDFEDSTSARGDGRLELREGAIQQYEALQGIGRMLKIRELEQLEFKKAHLQFRVVAGAVLVEDLVLGSDNLELQAAGRMEADTSLDLDAQLLLQRNITRRLPDLTKENMVDVPDRPGFRALAFKVGGTLDDPESNLMEKLVGERLEEQVTGAIMQFLGKKKKKKLQDSGTKP